MTLHTKFFIALMLLFCVEIGTMLFCINAERRPSIKTVVVITIGTVSGLLLLLYVVALLPLI
jgi:hypothetical protein